MGTSNRDPGMGSEVLTEVMLGKHPCPHMGHSRHGSAPAAAGDSSLQPIPHRKTRKLVSASRFPPAVPQDAMQSSLMHLDSFMGMRKCFQVSHKVPLRSQSHSIFSALITTPFPATPALHSPMGLVEAPWAHACLALWGAELPFAGGDKPWPCIP